jgi:hypothetical protein
MLSIKKCNYGVGWFILQTTKLCDMIKKHTKNIVQREGETLKQQKWHIILSIK